MRRQMGVLLGLGLALLLATEAAAVKLVFRPKLERHKTTGDLVILITLANEEEKGQVTAVRLEEAELQIKGLFSQPETPLPLVVGDIEAKKEESFSIRFDHRVGKKGEVGMLRLKAVADKEFVSGFYRVRLP